MSSGRCGAACAPSHTTTAPTLPRDRAQLRDGVDRAERVRDVVERDDLRARPDERREMVDVDRGRRSSGRQMRSLAPVVDRELLPGDEVGVVLEPRDDDLVAGAHVRASPRRRDEVERLGRAAGEDERGRRPARRRTARCAPARRDSAPSRAPRARTRRDAGWRCRARSSAIIASSTARGFCDVAAESR